MPTYRTQHIDLRGEPADFAAAPARYVGTNPELATWLGHVMRVDEVEDRIPVGDRSDVEVTYPEGVVRRPWLYVPIVERNEDGALLGYSL